MPSEWIALEWKDVDRTAGVITVVRTFAKGRVKNYGKTARSRRRVPLTARAAVSLEAIPRHLHTPLAGVPGGRVGPFMRVELDRYQARRSIDLYWSTDNDLCRAILHVLDEDEEDEEE